MKKAVWLTFILRSLCVLICLFSLCSCNGDDGDSDDSSSVPTEDVYQWLYQQQDNDTGLLSSQEDDRASTYINALTVMVFTLKNDNESLSKAERILDYFNSRCDDSEFYTENEARGFYQYRSSETGYPDTNSNRWMGDNAWLLMAIRYYKDSTGDTAYDSMADEITNLLESFQQPEGYIASGWEKGDNNFSTDGHPEGNLDAYNALLSYGKITAAEKVKQWLDFNDLDWKYGPLDLHSWRVLSLGSEYGFCLNDTDQYKRIIDYKNSEVTGFVPFTHLNNNIWSEGTGQMAVSFYKAGYKELGDKYLSELEKLLFEPAAFPGTQTVAYLALPDPDNYEWVHTDKGHVAGVCWYIFAKNRFDPFEGTITESPQIKNPICRIQAENYDTFAGGVRSDDRGGLYEGKAIHIAGDNDPACPDNDCSGWAEYSFNVFISVNNAAVSMRYTEDMEGDTCKIFLDNELIKSFIPKYTGTDDTSGWDRYLWTDSFPIEFIIEPGIHTLRVEGEDNKTYGFSIDCFHIDWNN